MLQIRSCGSKMGKFRRKIFYRIGAFAMFVILGLLILNHNQSELDNKEKIFIIEQSIRSPLNKGVCRLPMLPVENPQIMKYYKPIKKLMCGNSLDDWVKCEKSICFVKPEVIAGHGEIICSYTDIIRKTDHHVKYGATKKTKDPYVLQSSDFVKVACIAEDGKSWIGMAYGIRDSVDYAVPIAGIGQSINHVLNPPLNIDNQGSLFYNVLMFGFDSLSRNAVMRSLPKTYSYLTEDLEAIILQGYNIVGDGTPQALVPLLTGYTELELPETRHRMENAKHVDVYPMIWKEYKAQGYVTSFNEDVPSIGTFTYRMNGFNEQPVDHYMRTFYMEKENIWTSSEKYCIGHQADHVVMMDYTKNFMEKYKDAPRFVFSFHGGLSHDSVNDIAAADDDVVAWLNKLKAKNILDNTILIFMADHGNRFSEIRATLQGKQEERLPFFSFAFPESFKKRFPQPYSNFVKNSERLTTPFDVHATLQHILKLQKETSNDLYGDDTVPETTSSVSLSQLAKDRAISLFDNIPTQRSCADAYIEPHWCACLNWQQIQVNSTDYSGLLINLAGSIINAINMATRDYRSICDDLTLHKINWAMRLLPHKELLQFKGANDRDGYVADLTGQTHDKQEMYQLQIVVNPGESLFEASVVYDISTQKAKTKLSEVSRINAYGKQANCIYEVNPELRKYCYCKVQ